MPGNSKPWLPPAREGFGAGDRDPVLILLRDMGNHMAVLKVKALS